MRLKRLNFQRGDQVGRTWVLCKENMNQLVRPESATPPQWWGFTYLGVSCVWAWFITKVTRVSATSDIVLCRFLFIFLKVNRSSDLRQLVSNSHDETDTTENFLLARCTHTHTILLCAFAPLKSFSLAKWNLQTIKSSLPSPYIYDYCKRVTVFSFQENSLQRL